MTPDFIEQLAAIMGADGYKTEGLERYTEDPRHTFTGKAALVAMPRSTQQVSEIVTLCNAHRVPIIPYGGGTGVVAGQLAHETDVLTLSLERMTTTRDVNLSERTMTVEAGCILEVIHAEAATHDLQFPLSMASKGSASIGGNLATNAGGIQVLRYGNARDLCLGLEAVLPTGEILSELEPVRKNNTGYDLRHLLIGSEGTLGIITAATLKLEPIDPERVTVLCAQKSPSDALGTYNLLRKSLGNAIAAMELMSGLGMATVTRHFPTLNDPFAEKHPWYLLIEITGQPGIRNRTEQVLELCLEQELMQDAVVAESDTQRQNLWDLRENTPEANRMEGAVCNSDTAVPIAKVDAFIADTARRLRAINPELRLNSYGHIGDGNIHHNVFPAPGVSKTEFTGAHPDQVAAIRMAINDATVAQGGSISAEHGIGRLKTEDLQRYVSPAKRDMMRAIKQAVDPNNILNPGALIV